MQTLMELRQLDPNMTLDGTRLLIVDLQYEHLTGAAGLFARVHLGRAVKALKLDLADCKWFAAAQWNVKLVRCTDAHEAHVQWVRSGYHFAVYIGFYFDPGLRLLRRIDRHLDEVRVQTPAGIWFDRSENRLA